MREKLIIHSLIKEKPLKNRIIKGIYVNVDCDLCPVCKITNTQIQIPNLSYRDEKNKNFIRNCKIRPKFSIIE